MVNTQESKQDEEPDFIYNVNTKIVQTPQEALTSNRYYVYDGAPNDDEFDYLVSWTSPIKLFGISFSETNISACTSDFARDNVIPESKFIQINNTATKELSHQQTCDSLKDAMSNTPSFVVFRCDKNLIKKGVHVQIDVSVENNETRFPYHKFEKKTILSIFNEVFSNETDSDYGLYGVYGNKKCESTQNPGISLFMFIQTKITSLLFNQIKDRIKSRIFDQCQINIHSQNANVYGKKSSNGFTNINLDEWKKQHLPLSELVYLVKGKDDGRDAWYYVLVDPEKHDKFLRDLNDNVIHLEDSGHIIRSAYGDNPDESVTKELERIWVC